MIIAMTVLLYVMSLGMMVMYYDLKMIEQQIKLIKRLKGDK